MLAIIIASAIMGKPNLTTCPKNRKHYSFQRDYSFGGDRDDKLTHEVCLNSYRIGKYEVTQGQWKAVMGNNPSGFSSCGYDCPVEKVSWDDTQKFIRKLNRQTGKKYRLPTEAEWEYAARSGGRQEKYSGGNDVDAVAWVYENSWSKTHPVGQKQANGLGIYDMTGNVAEWCQDWEGDYSSDSQHDPQGPSSGSDRVVRGGSWRLNESFALASRHGSSSPDTRFHTLGFRLAYSPSVQ